MDINLTLFVQMGNFMLAYGMIRTLLIKPVYAVLIQEAAEQHDLQEMVESRSIILAQKEREKNEQWKAHQLQLLKAMPQNTVEHLFVTSHESFVSESTAISQAEIERLTHEIARAVVKKVEEDHA